MSQQEPTNEEVERVIRGAHYNREERMRLERIVVQRDAEIARLKGEFSATVTELRKRIEYSERREATIDDDYQEARREVTVLTTLLDQIIDTCQAALAQANVAKHGFGSSSQRKTGESAQDAIAEALGLDRNNLPTPPPPRTVRTEARPNRLAKMVDDLTGEKMPAFLRRGPMSPAEREPAEETNKPLRALADMLTGRETPIAPEHPREPAWDPVDDDRRHEVEETDFADTRPKP